MPLPPMTPTIGFASLAATVRYRSTLPGPGGALLKTNPASEDRRSLGRRGETLAAEYLQKKGYRVLGRNVRAGGVELDLVAAHARTIVFVEVKTRRSRAQGAPELAVDARKRARLVRGAAAWLRDHSARAARVRFDVISCEPDARGELCARHLPGAFDAGD